MYLPPPSNGLHFGGNMLNYGYAQFKAERFSSPRLDLRE